MLHAFQAARPATITPEQEGRLKHVCLLFSLEHDLVPQVVYDYGRFLMKTRKTRKADTSRTSSESPDFIFEAVCIKVAKERGDERLWDAFPRMKNKLMSVMRPEGLLTP